MGRPNQCEQKREDILPIIARTFSEFGYRRTTTARLARRCAVRENVLYRLWPDKKAMFLAAIRYVYVDAARTWRDVEASGGGGTSAGRLLDYQSSHHGEGSLYRIVFAGLNDSDDPEVREAMAHMYGRFHRLIRGHLDRSRRTSQHWQRPDSDLLAWAIVGLGTVGHVMKELGLLDSAARRRLIGVMGRYLIDGTVSEAGPSSRGGI